MFFAMVVLLLLIFIAQFFPSTQKFINTKPYFIVAQDYEPQRNHHFYIYDINHPAMQKNDGTIKTREDFFEEVLAQNAQKCHFIQPENIGLVTPSELQKFRENSLIYKNQNGQSLERKDIIKNFEKLLIQNQKILPTDTLTANKDSIYYYNLRKLYYDDNDTTLQHSLKWGYLQNNGTISPQVLKANAVLPITIHNQHGEELNVYQATLRFYTWRQVCGKKSFEKITAPLMSKGILSKKAVQIIQKLNQSGECVLIENVIIEKDGTFIEISDRFKFVIKHSVVDI